MTVPSKCTCAGRNGLKESTDYRAKNFCTKRDEKARFYFSNDEMARGIFYVFLALCVVGTLRRLVLAIRTRIRHRQQSRDLERGLAEYLAG
jgi:hypothetical protein